jgi:predicted house-cleaning noncanonical NTP pyrophosphatase (MazG superfamily)
MNNVKKKLLDEFISMSQGKTGEELLPLMLAVSQKAKQLGISFTKEETLALVNQLKSNLSENEKAQVDMLINLML